MDNNTLPNGFMKIPLSGRNGLGLFALVDEEDYDMLSQYKWFNVGGYAKRTEHYNDKNGKRKNRLISMHRSILSPPDDKIIDHKNHNKLDNRKKNLRICTAKENRANTKLTRCRWSERLQKWVVTFKRDGKWVKRCFNDEKEAIEQSRLAASGVDIKKRTNQRNKYLPKYISRYSISDGEYRYLYRQVVNKRKYVKCGFKTILEAVEYRNKIQYNIIRNGDNGK